MGNMVSNLFIVTGRVAPSRAGMERESATKMVPFVWKFPTNPPCFAPRLDASISRGESDLRPGSAQAGLERRALPALVKGLGFHAG